MTQKTDAIYYDGLSSKPQAIEVFFDKTKSCFQFINEENKTLKWNLTDVLFVKTGQNLTIQLKENTLQNISIKEPTFIKNLDDFRAKNGHYSWYEKFVNQNFKTHAFIAFLLLGFIGLGYVYFIPWAAEKSVVLIPEEYDNHLGNLFFEQNTLFDAIDVKKTKALNLFAQELELKNTKKLKFTVIDSDIVNAFALPDGNIVIYTGILNSMQNYDELVGLIGHETSHVNNRHAMKMICRNLSGYIFISAVLGDANGVMATIGDNVNTLQSLSFSRAFEHEADSDGFKILVNNKVNPKGMSNLFKRLQDEESSISVPEFLSSHPVTTERISFINKMIQSKKYTFDENLKLKNLFDQIKQ
jgi:beta-barrel assembly-enhancing protease